jgi:hypothetical protein
MYLFTRQARLTGADAMSWATTIGARAAKVTEHEVGVYARTYSPAFGTVVWTSWWDDLGTMSSSFAKLVEDNKYLGLVADGADVIQGGVDDSLYESVYDGANAVAGAAYVASVSAVCANGQVAKGIANGVALAQKFEAITAHSTRFVHCVTGPYAGVGWLTSYTSMADFQEANAKANADAQWVDFVDASVGSYIEDAATTQSVLYMRLA